MAPPDVRPAAQAHAGAIAALSQGCFAVQKEQWRTGQVRAHLQAPAGRGWIVPGDGDAATGYLLALSAGDKGDILSLAVAPGARGAGLAKALMQACIHSLRKDGRTVLLADVRASNAPARRLYEACGMKTVFIRDAYYTGAGGTGREAGIVFARDL